ncbi:hypothetical protein DIE08_18320 [Burkholderia sp. Bp9004]|nr:hypothetical protein DIE08_18320 [Burkholderia sp. Bp9004]
MDKHSSSTVIREGYALRAVDDSREVEAGDPPELARFTTGLVNETLVMDIAGRVAELMTDVAAVVRGSVMTITSSSYRM